ncbi:hypothetical protein [Rheinheimera sp. WS51]|uniref:hypothetical protein n=1 Tax=Rheinheimera sp. WS51 TaxID=3425886 RepID=UPI003D934FA2
MALKDIFTNLRDIPMGLLLLVVLGAAPILISVLEYNPSKVGWTYAFEYIVIFMLFVSAVAILYRKNWSRAFYVISFFLVMLQSYLTEIDAVIEYIYISILFSIVIVFALGWYLFSSPSSRGYFRR